MNAKQRTVAISLIATLLLSIVLSACGGKQPAEAMTMTNMPGHDHPMAPLSEMPMQVRVGEPRLQEAYQFAVANRDITEQVPCYCGCGGIGHINLQDCYVSSGPGEKLAFDAHAQGCQICVDITHDTMRMMDEGKSAAEIYDYVAAEYAQYGPPTPMN